MLCVTVNFVRKKWLFVRLQVGLQVLKNFPRGTKQKRKKKGGYRTVAFFVAIKIKLWRVYQKEEEKKTF